MRLEDLINFYNYPKFIEKYENKERRKKIDDFYANDEDENLNRKRGKHF